MTYLAIADHLRADFNQLLAEASSFNDCMVRPTWEARTHHYPLTLHAYLMSAFSRLDLYSRLWKGAAEPRDQTNRMRTFLGKYLPGREPIAHALAVQLARHTLMHTSRPRKLRDESSNEVYTYLMHWGEPHLTAEQHYVVQNFQLVLGLQHLLDDFSGMLEVYLKDLLISAELQKNAEEVWADKIVSQFVKDLPSYIKPDIEVLL